jgi:hypothetical protein
MDLNAKNTENIPNTITNISMFFSRILSVWNQ